MEPAPLSDLPAGYGRAGGGIKQQPNVSRHPKALVDRCEAMRAAYAKRLAQENSERRDGAAGEDSKLEQAILTADIRKSLVEKRQKALSEKKKKVLGEKDSPADTDTDTDTDTDVEKKNRRLLQRGGGGGGGGAEGGRDGGGPRQYIMGHRPSPLDRLKEMIDKRCSDTKSLRGIMATLSSRFHG
jgi:hypothetical protein